MNNMTPEHDAPAGDPASKVGVARSSRPLLLVGALIAPIAVFSLYLFCRDGRTIGSTTRPIASRWESQRFLARCASGDCRYLDDFDCWQRPSISSRCSHSSPFTD